MQINLSGPEKLDDNIYDTFIATFKNDCSRHIKF